jgi:hypothetical protein
MDEGVQQMSEFAAFCAYNSGNTCANWKFL